MGMFDKQARSAAKYVLQCIRLGYVSNPIEILLFYKLKIHSYGLIIYRFIHRSNDVEGRIYMNIVKKFVSYNASPDLANRALANYLYT